MDEKNSGVKRSPREALIDKELVGYEIKDTSTDVSPTKTGLSKTGKAGQPSWARG